VRDERINQRSPAVLRGSPKFSPETPDVEADPPTSAEQIGERFLAKGIVRKPPTSKPTSPYAVSNWIEGQIFIDGDGG